MGLFNFPDWSDPQTQARVQGALSAMAANIAQPGSNIGTMFGSLGGGAQSGLEKYQTNQANQLGIANDRFGIQQKLAPVNFMRSLQGQAPLTLDDVMKGNFGTQPGATQAPMSPPPVASSPIDPGFSPPGTQSGPNIDPGFSPAVMQGGKLIDPGFSPPMGAPNMTSPQTVATSAPTSQQLTPASPQQLGGTPPAVSSMTPQTPVGQASSAPRAQSIIPPELMNSPLFQAALQSGDSSTVMSMLTKRQTLMSPSDLAEAGLPPDTVAYRDPISGKPDVTRMGVIKSPEEIQSEVDEEQRKGLKSPAEIAQDLETTRKKDVMSANIQAPSVERNIVMPLMQKMLAGQPLSQQEQAVLTLAKPQALTGPQGLQPVDPTNGSLQGQTGLSQAAINYITTGQAPRGTAAYMAITKEIDDFARKNGINTVTLKAQAKGYNDVLTNNIQRNNQGQILENELQGSVANVAPLADAIGNGKISAANLASIWAGKQVNDPTVLQYKDQLVRLQHELAGYNAVAGGKLTEGGTPRVEQSDLDSAANTITQGINSGGLRGLANSIGMSTAKNKAVLGGAIDDANQGMWNLFGVGQNYKRQNPGVGGGAPAPQINPSSLPANARMQLKANTVTTFKNGSKWTLQNGQPVQVQ